MKALPTFLMVALSLALYGCDHHHIHDHETHEEKQERVTQESLVTLDRLNKLKKMCDDNGGTKELNLAKNCGRYCTGAYIECNNGMALWLK